MESCLPHFSAEFMKFLLEMPTTAVSLIQKGKSKMEKREGVGGGGCNFLVDFE